jgi:hypothetical protein
MHIGGEVNFVEKDSVWNIISAVTVQVASFKYQPITIISATDVRRLGSVWAKQVNGVISAPSLN